MSQLTVNTFYLLKNFPYSSKCFSCGQMIGKTQNVKLHAIFNEGGDGSICEKCFSENEKYKTILKNLRYCLICLSFLENDNIPPICNRCEKESEKYSDKYKELISM